MINTSIIAAMLLNMLYASLMAYSFGDVFLIAPDLLSPLQIVSFTVALITPYFLPSLIAIGRQRHNTAAIFALNLFLGWTLIGWVASLVWSLTGVRPSSETRLSTDH